MYQALLDCTSEYPDPKAYFCMQWGRNFAPRKGILFVGRSVNGWNCTNPRTVDEIFSGENRAFMRDDQMDWVKFLYGGGTGYSTSRSAFWRVIRKVTLGMYDDVKDTWPSYIAWSNLYKVSPATGGNPRQKLAQAQYEQCKEILKAEIDFLAPLAVVVLTGARWGNTMEFIEYLNGEEKIISKHKEKWKAYATNLYLIDGVRFIVSEHPQRKPEGPHAECLLKLLRHEIT